LNHNTNVTFGLDDPRVLFDDDIDIDDRIVEHNSFNDFYRNYYFNGHHEEYEEITVFPEGPTFKRDNPLLEFLKKNKVLIGLALLTVTFLMFIRPRAKSKSSHPTNQNGMRVSP